MKNLLYISLLFLASCSIDKKCHRLERKIVKNAKYCQMVLKDTITVKDTVYVGTVRHDSTFVMRNDIDTFYLNKDRLHVKVITQDSLIYVEGQCDSVVIIREIHVPYDSVEVKEMNVWLRGLYRGLKRWLIIIIMILVVALAWKHKGKLYAGAKKIPFIRNYLP